MARRRKNNGVKHKKSGNRRPAEAYNDEIIKVRPKAKRKGSPINVLTVILFAVILGYLVKYAIDFASDDMTVEIETVNYGTIDIPNSFRGLIVRDEYVVKASRSGEPIFNFGEGDKVKKNAVVCTVRESETAQNAESRLQMLDESIIETQKNRIDISKYKEDIIRIENNIESAIASSQSRISAGYLSDIYTLRTTIQTQMDIRTGIWINENSESSDSLASQRRTYQTQLTNSTESLRAPESGILVLSCDENEEKFTYNGVGDITEDDIKDTYNINYLSKTTAVEAGSPVFKIITNSNWKLCAYIDSSVASEWNTGDVKIIRATVNKEDISVEMTIDSMTVKEDNTYVVFKTSNSIQDFLSARSVDFYIIDSTYEGLKIPNTAIIEKTFIKIPSSCIAESLNGKSVVKRTNGKDEVVGIQVAYDDEQFSYVRQDFDVIKIGDVLVSGSGEGAAECRLSEVATRVGVLTANGAYTKFAAISVMGQNSQYTIADPSGSVLKAYDKIISNASGINEGDEIY